MAYALNDRFRMGIAEVTESVVFGVLTVLSAGPDDGTVM
ncbi:hypothetical protein JJ691_103150 [Kutzneria sp. CA-103260]|nr:hypothetical protein JJ691_103150 [Kutzneria sp. CA-103260]